MITSVKKHLYINRTIHNTSDKNMNKKMSIIIGSVITFVSVLIPNHLIQIIRLGGIDFISYGGDKNTIGFGFILPWKFTTISHNIFGITDYYDFPVLIIDILLVSIIIYGLLCLLGTRRIWRRGKRSRRSKNKWTHIKYAPGWVWKRYKNSRYKHNPHYVKGKTFLYKIYRKGNTYNIYKEVIKK